LFSDTNAAPCDKWQNLLSQWSHTLHSGWSGGYMPSMTFWILAAALTVLVTAALYAGARRAVAAPAGAQEATLAIYKDQLAEIERDLKQGILGAEEAEGQRAEIGRRLIAAARDLRPDKIASPARPTPLLALLLVPALAVAIYAWRGAPHLPDVPRAERLAAARDTGDMEALLAQVESHLENNPGDLTGWKLLIPNYLSLGRYAEAAAAIARVMELEGPKAELYADLAEALVFANQGLMTAEAEKAVLEALRLDPRNPKALYFEAQAILQKGDRAGARTRLEALLAQSPADAPWRPAIAEQLQQLADTAGPSAADVEAAAGMSTDERQAMIRTMVDGLDARLAENSNDLAGWLKLIRARSVLGEPDQARAALIKAKEIFAGNSQALSDIDNLAKELNL
jgi:cytochrome c-type biogenesis protein CcmH